MWIDHLNLLVCNVCKVEDIPISQTVYNLYGISVHDKTYINEKDCFGCHNIK